MSILSVKNNLYKCCGINFPRPLYDNSFIQVALVSPMGWVQEGLKIKDHTNLAKILLLCRSFVNNIFVAYQKYIHVPPAYYLTHFPYRWFLIYSVRSSNVNDIEAKVQTFRYRSLLSERKQNILIWSAHYRNESKTFWFGPKKFLLQADRFPFGPTILGRSKAIWFGL